MDTKQTLENRMNWYAQQRDNAYVAYKRAFHTGVKLTHRRLFEKYSDKFNQAYQEWKALETK